jgi:tripartite-type tricarboxylate transporter receptor subunit TctC
MQQRPLTRRRLAAGVPAAGLTTGAGLPARAQSDPGRRFPVRPIRLIVGFVPGAGNHLLARLLAQKHGAWLAQPVLVQNKPGAGAVSATELVAKAAPTATRCSSATGASVDSRGVSRAAFAAHIGAEIPRWTRIAKVANIRLA